jgi:hypothetical protein
MTVPQAARQQSVLFAERGECVEQLLKALLEDLDAIMEEHEDIGDTDVSIQMTRAVHDGFVSPIGGFVLPNRFGMYTREGDRKVRAALQRFLKKATKVAQAEGLDTPEARLAAFQNMDVWSEDEEGGSCYNDYFGHYERPPDTSNR